MYSWWTSDLPTDENVQPWLKNKEYKNSPLSFKAPPVITTHNEYLLIQANTWLRNHIGWGFWNIIKDKPYLPTIF
jgi:hypothetical protein